ncbi:conserved hypothetical protein [Nostocoides japonicum T1-X7]|uniref:ArsA/GET3 Anion-transporting ATPase-like domain-containing protein n=1 Tax=Nostocoides japonicum T1-X7 TaxID=1194083 RepID=A0A077M0Y7_9MICO|nr:ArsA-related P-loop ATPase [Tetrasphaera japonica]CCH77854.1 conserved hypothetical protein [Tetrasphaera japonica T1-X7]
MAANPTRSFGGARLHIVTGKGGTGKTTVASAMAIAMAEQGHRVLLAEVEGRQGIAQTFDVAPIGTEEVRILSHRSGGEVWGLAVDAKAALMEYLQTFYRLGRAGSVLERVGAIDFATTIAPGVRDVLLIGKVYEAVGRTTGHKRGKGDLVWDAVVLDAPPTGRITRFLNVNAEVADVAKVGPIRGQADSITRLLHSARTVVHVVTLLEEMPVQETVDALAEIRAIEVPLGAIVVNEVTDPVLPFERLRAVATEDEERRYAMSSALRDDLTSVGVRVGDAMIGGLLTEALAIAERVEIEQEQAAVVKAQGLPVIRLPWLPDGIEGGGLGTLADALRAQGVG